MLNIEIFIFTFFPREYVNKHRVRDNKLTVLLWSVYFLSYRERKKNNYLFLMRQCNIYNKNKNLLTPKIVTL